MDDEGNKPIIAPPKRHRWAIREIWFVLAAILVIIIGIFISPYVHVSRGAPIGKMPTSQPTMNASH